MRSSLLFILACLLLLASSATAEPLGFTVYCEYPKPQKLVEGDKVGLVYAQVLELMKRTQTPGHVKVVSWKRGYDEALKKGNVALFPTTRMPERETLFHWIGPLLSIEWAFFAHAGSDVKIKSIDDARKVRSIGTYAQDSKEQWLKKRGFTNLVSVLDNQTNIRKLYTGRIDLMVETPSIIYQWPKKYGFDPSELIKVYTFNKVDLYLAISKDTPRQTVEAYRQAFDDMLMDGTIRKLYDMWAPGLESPTPE